MAPTNFERIGMSFGRLQAGFDYADMPRAQPTTIQSITGAYTVLTGTSGEAIWFADDAQGAAVTINPMFCAGTSFTATLDRLHEGTAPFAYSEADADLSILEEGQVATRAQVLMVNLASLRTEESRGLLGRRKRVDAPVTEFTGKTLTLRLAVFAGRAETFADAQAYIDSQTAENPFGAPSFLPAGMFPDSEGRTAPTCLGAGQVSSCGTAPSSFLGPDFHWAVVEAIGGALGVVWAPEDGPATTQGAVLSYQGMIIGQMEEVLD